MAEGVKASESSRKPRQPPRVRSTPLSGNVLASSAAGGLYNNVSVPRRNTALTPVRRPHLAGIGWLSFLSIAPVLESELRISSSTGIKWRLKQCDWPQIITHRLCVCPATSEQNVFIFYFYKCYVDKWIGFNIAKCNIQGWQVRWFSWVCGIETFEETVSSSVLLWPLYPRCYACTTLILPLSTQKHNDVIC